MASFYDGDSDPVEPAPQQQSGELEGPDVTLDTESQNRPRSQTNKPTTKIATLSTLNNSSDDEEEGQAFYAGGSEHSGQQVLGPPKKKDVVADMFKSVRE